MSGVSAIFMTNRFFFAIFYHGLDRIGCVMVDVLASSVVYCGLEPRSGQTKTLKLAF